MRELLRKKQTTNSLGLIDLEGKVFPNTPRDWQIFDIVFKSKNNSGVFLDGS